MGDDRAEGRLSGAGGIEIYWQAWLPPGQAKGVVLISHGAAEHSGRYAWVGAQLVARGYAAYALDHRGHGRSGAPRAYVDRLANTVSDLHELRSVAADRHPGAPCFLLGHSMGGLIALSYALDHQDGLAGLILSAPLAHLEAGRITTAAGRITARIAPRLPVYKIDSTTVSRDPAVVSAYERDPLNHRGLLPARTVGELAAGVASLPERLPTLRLPVLVAYGTGDRLVDPAGSRKIADLAGSRDCTVIDYEGLYHEVLNEPERERVMTDICNWIDTRVTSQAPVATT